MKKREQIALLIFCLYCGFFSTVDAVGSPAKKNNEQILSVKDSIVIDNQILATVQDHVITVLDLTKKMDMIFYRQYPEYRASPEARLQFYQAHWKDALNEMIDRQLAFAYAEEKQFQVSRADIRQEMEELFGPDVMLNLYENGLQLYDVESMLEADILMRQLLLYAIKMPVINSITPKDIRQEYERRLKQASEEAKKDEEWVWRAFTISKPASMTKNFSASQMKNIISKIKSAPSNETNPILLQESNGVIEIMPSAPFTSNRSTITPHMVHQMESTSPGEPTDLIEIQSQKNEIYTWRSYLLLSKKSLAPREIDFQQQEAHIKQEMIDQMVEEKRGAFFADLERQYGVHRTFSNEELDLFNPFQLNQIL